MGAAFQPRFGHALDYNYRGRKAAPTPTVVFLAGQSFIGSTEISFVILMAAKVVGDLADNPAPITFEP